MDSIETSKGLRNAGSPTLIYTGGFDSSSSVDTQPSAETRTILHENIILATDVVYIHYYVFPFLTNPLPSTPDT